MQEGKERSLFRSWMREREHRQQAEIAENTENVERANTTCQVHADRFLAAAERDTHSIYKSGLHRGTYIKARLIPRRLISVT